MASRTKAVNLLQRLLPATGGFLKSIDPPACSGAGIPRLAATLGSALLQDVCNPYVASSCAGSAAANSANCNRQATETLAQQPLLVHLAAVSNHKVPICTSRDVPSRPRMHLLAARQLSTGTVLSWRARYLHSCASVSAPPDKQGGESDQQGPNSQQAGLGPAQPDTAGWTREQVVNLPNAISMARLLSGPVSAYFIIAQAWAPALMLVAAAGVSDWADGYLARQMHVTSPLGSYLDPLADKVFIVCVVGALGAQGALPGPLVALVVGRDVLLVAGAFIYRAQSLHWRWPGAREFFRLVPPADGLGAAQQSGEDMQNGSLRAPAAPSMTPLYISKVNTVVQIALVGSCLLSSWQGWPSSDVVLLLAGLTAATTAASSYGYVHQYITRKLPQPK